MEIAIGVLGLLAAGFGAWVFVLIRGQGGLRDQVREVASARDVLAAENDRVNEETRRVRDELAEATSKAEESSGRVVTLSVEKAQLVERLDAVEQIRLEFSKNEARLKEAFGSLSASALKSSRDEFLRQIKPVFEAANEKQAEALKPMDEVLKLTRVKLDEIEKARIESFATLNHSMSSLMEVSKELGNGAIGLANALRKPKVRGNYGEIQLVSVAELAGLRRGIHFNTEVVATDSSGKTLRADMIVNLATDRHLIVDAKTNIQPYLDAFETTDADECEEYLDKFAQGIWDQITDLSKKGYWEAFKETPDFVIMFVPGDQFVDAALQRKPEILEKAWKDNIILASPTTLVGLMRSIELGWRERKFAQNAEELRAIGIELHKRSSTLLNHLGSLGKSLNSSVSAFNSTASSFSRMLVPQLRKFEESGMKSAKALNEAPEISALPEVLLGFSDDADAQEV